MPELKLEHSLVDGRYEVYERLSRGSYAEIFVAYDRATNRSPIVIKALNTSLQGTPDPDLERTLVENFQNEAIALDAVRHPHVILRLGHGTAADLRGVPFHFLVLEYMPGGDLLELCRHRPTKSLPLSEALLYFHQACEALSYAHSKGIIHRDLKPNNFLLSANKRTLKIADFGVAKITTGESSEITRVGADVYAPPEHNPNETTGELLQLTTAADVYSLAKSFYTVVCGRSPNQFRCDPITALPENIVNQPWADALLKVLCRATDDDPRSRYATVAEFWHELAQVAVLAPSAKAEELPDEVTIVKPRLGIPSGALPKTPVQPDFDPIPATSRIQVAVVSATPVETEPLTEPLVESKPVKPVIAVKNEAQSDSDLTPKTRPADRQSKIFIELQPQKPKPVTPLSAPGKPQPAQVLQTDQARLQGKQKGKAQPQKITSRFSEKMRRRVFIAFLGAAFLGLLVSVYNLFKGGEFGAPREIEVTITQLNVREGPSMNYNAIGVVAQGTRHKVISRNDQWLQIEVGQWMQLNPGVPLDSKQGWVYGNPDYVRVVSRRWW